VEYTILVALVDLSASKYPGARKRLPLFLPPEARSPRPVAIGEEASKLQEGSPLGSAARMLCAGFAMAPWVATNGQETLVACCHYRQARTNISGQVGRQCQTRMHEPRRIRRQKPRAKLPNPAGIGTAD